MERYVLSVSLCALCCGLAGRISGCDKSVRLVGGIILALVLLQPVGKLRQVKLPEDLVRASDSGQCYVDEGKALAGKDQALHIQTACEAYILEKARYLGESLQAQILLDENLLPAEAVLRGDISGTGRAQLEEVLQNDLGITKENLQWIGNQEQNG